VHVERLDDYEGGSDDGEEEGKQAPGEVRRAPRTMT